MKVFISGGCKNGKSAYAQELACKMRKPDAPLYYIATMIPADEEDETRITKHRKDRESYGFETIEAGRDILAAVRMSDKRGTFLLDSVTALLANEMFPADGRAEPDAYIKVADDLAQLVAEISDMVIVSDFIYSDAYQYDELTEAYRRGLACIDRRIAKICEAVIEASAGVFFVYKSAAQ